jgi:hypothetical protein
VTRADAPRPAPPEAPAPYILDDLERVAKELRAHGWADWPESIERALVVLRSAHPTSPEPRFTPAELNAQRIIDEWRATHAQATPPLTVERLAAALRATHVSPCGHCDRGNDETDAARLLVELAATPEGTDS